MSTVSFEGASIVQGSDHLHLTEGVSMGLLSFLQRKKKDGEQIPEPVSSEVPEKKSPTVLTTDQNEDVIEREIPEHIFIEYPKHKPTVMEEQETTTEVHNLNSLYRFLERNLEKQGYEDALINPDTSYMDEQVSYIQNELHLLLSRVGNYYSGHIKHVNFHIDTRRRSGMVETVDELLTHKETVEEEMKIVAGIGKDAQQGVGLCQNLFLSYKRGFRNGFAAITYNTILGRKN